MKVARVPYFQTKQTQYGQCFAIKIIFFYRRKSVLECTAKSVISYDADAAAILKN